MQNRMSLKFLDVLSSFTLFLHEMQMYFTTNIWVPSNALSFIRSGVMPGRILKYTSYVFRVPIYISRGLAVVIFYKACVTMFCVSTLMMRRLIIIPPYHQQPFQAGFTIGLWTVVVY